VKLHKIDQKRQSVQKVIIRHKMEISTTAALLVPFILYNVHLQKQNKISNVCSYAVVCTLTYTVN